LAAIDEFHEQRRLLARLFNDFGRRHWVGYAIALGFLSLVAGMTGLSAWIMQDVVNDIFIEKRSEMVPVIAGGVATIFIVKGIAGYISTLLLARVGNSIVAEIQMRLFDHVQRQRIDFYDTFTSGVLATRLSHNANAARGAIDLIVTSMGRDVFTLIALVIVMIVQDPLLSALALLVGPPAAYAEWLLVRKVKSVARAEFLSMAKIVSTVQQTAQGTRVVKAFGLEPAMRDEMESAVDGVRERANRIAQVRAATNPMMETFGGLAIAGVILYGGWRVIDGGGDPGAFFSFITAFLMAYEPAKRLAKLNINLQASLVGAEMMYQLLDEEPQIEEAPDARPLAVTGGEVRLEEVRFAYRGNAAALNGLSLAAPAGKVTALVGPSGAGKSTIFSMIERFYDPDSGRVAIDGQDLRGVTFGSLRGAVAYVSQDAFLFDDTVLGNIRMGRPDATDEEVIEAAKAANAHEFVTRMAKGYHTGLGENGARLSGGERQRIAIARAMLRGAPILLLDEPTSALDAETEARVAEALERLMRGRTTIVIAHRLATVRHADVIHVIRDGRVVESGTHDELKRNAGLYAHLHNLQFAE
jgi:ATP-binding cassette subfamily B protein